MIVTYRTRTEVLCTRPQTAHAHLGEQVILAFEGEVAQQYRVIDVVWPLVLSPRSYYAITDEADVAVHIILEPYQAQE